MTTLQYAQYYVSKGLSIIPVQPKSKKPAIKSWKEFQHRQPTAQELEEFLAQHPEHNIAIVTGQISGIVVVDLDTKEAIEWAEKNLPMGTPTVITGKGRQLYYKHPMDREIRNFQNRDDLKGIDLRGDGGYVVAPPSIHPSGKQYQWAEGKSLDDVPLQPFPAELLVETGTKKPLAHLNSGVQEGSRNNSLARLVGSWANDKLSLEQCLENAFLWNAKNQPPLPDDEVTRTVKSIFDKHRRELPENILDARLETATAEDMPELLDMVAKVKSATKKDLYIQRLAAKFDVGKRALQKDLREIVDIDPEEKPEKVEKNMIACFPGLVDLVSDGSNNVAFLVKHNDELQVVTEWPGDDILYVPPTRDTLTFSLPRAQEVIKWYGADSDQQLFIDVVNYFKRFSCLSDECWWVLACFTALTYVQDHRNINYLPMPLFYADPERGKSRTGKAIINIAYRGIHLADFREANIFRFSQNLQATLFFDVTDLQKKVRQHQSEDLLLCRFEKGATVSRVLFPDRGAFKDMKHFIVYGPTVIATNSPIHRVLDTRCLPIVMPSKPGYYEDPTAEKGHALKERLVAWRARVMNKPLPAIDIIEGLSGRFWDITKPLLQICMMVQPAKFEELKSTLLDMARQKLEEKSDSIEASIIRILGEKHPVIMKKYLSEHRIRLSVILEELNRKIDDEKYKFNSKALGRKMQAMGFPKTSSGGHSVIIVKISDLKTLCSQYGLDFPEVEILGAPPRLTPTSTNTPHIVKNQDVTQGESKVGVSNSHLTPTSCKPVIRKAKVAEVEVGGSSGGDEKNNISGVNTPVIRLVRKAKSAGDVPIAPDNEMDEELKARIMEALEPYRLKGPGRPPSTGLN